MDESEMARQGARAKINPPLRSRKDVEDLWRLLAAGRIDYVTTDHVGWTPDRKAGRSIFEAKSGVPALEVFLPLFFDAAVVKRKMSPGRVADLLCENPARRLRLWPRKGAIQVGADADLVLFDPDRRWRIDETATVAGWSPYHGREVQGAIERVILRGGVVTGQPGDGRWIRPHSELEPAVAG
jgi:allantoinase